MPSDEKGRFPPIEPYATGMLDVGDGQSVYWESSGNPDGKPVVLLHGGPGGGSSPGWRRWFDPERYRIVQLDRAMAPAAAPSEAQARSRISKYSRNAIGAPAVSVTTRGLGSG